MCVKQNSSEIEEPTTTVPTDCEEQEKKSIFDHLTLINYES